VTKNLDYRNLFSHRLQGNSVASDRGDVEDEDDDEYFDPDSYNREVHDADEQPQNEEAHLESDEDDDEIFDPDNYEAD
jgi:hypothetical protein